MTAYEVRISDWSSDVCSSDLKMPLTLDILASPFDFCLALERRDERTGVPKFPILPTAVIDLGINRFYPSPRPGLEIPVVKFDAPSHAGEHVHSLPDSVVDALSGEKRITILSNGFRSHSEQYGVYIGRASCWERVCQYEKISG